MGLPVINVPAPLWDELDATSGYVTNLTATSTLDGKTPYELLVWSLTFPRLRKIGRRVFTPIQTHNPKIYQRSTPCVLIGYAPRSKDYWL